MHQRYCAPGFVEGSKQRVLTAPDGYLQSWLDCVAMLEPQVDLSAQEMDILTHFLTLCHLPVVLSAIHKPCHMVMLPTISEVSARS